MMNGLKETIDLKVLEDELQEALRADELYQLQNDAKLRAIEQNVPTYDHFREMVNGAHLRPLERSDTQKKSHTPWNMLCNNQNTDFAFDSLETSEAKYPIEISVTAPPKSSLEFTKIWNKIIDPASRIEYLLQFKGLFTEKLFRAELPPEFLGQVFETCLEAFSDDTNALIIDTLLTLSRCNRFNLSLQFLSKTEKTNCQTLFEKLKTAQSSSNEKCREAFENLLKMYTAIL